MKCKICNKTELNKVLSLGKQPLANKYPKNNYEIINEKKYSLDLLFCKNCKNVKIKKIISRNEMFKDYYYLSSINKGLVNHFNNLAKELNNAQFVLDIGSNDGILLKPLKDLNVKAIGIDPSINVGKIANNQGLKTIVSFFNNDVVKLINNEHSKPDAIIASSVFTHIEKPKYFANNIKKLLSKDGVFILEIEYLQNFIQNIQFERFYFDRPYYYSATSLFELFKSVGMIIVDVKKINIHGGSLRFFIKHNIAVKPKLSITSLIEKERLYFNLSVFKKFKKKIDFEADNLRSKLCHLKKSGKKIIGYGAPARVATITNLAKINSNIIEFIIDDNPLKQNKFSPGMHIPIYSSKKLESYKPDIVVVFAYEYFSFIKEKFVSINCKFYKPIPFEIIK